MRNSTWPFLIDVFLLNKLAAMNLEFEIESAIRYLKGMAGKQESCGNLLQEFCIQSIRIRILFFVAQVATERVSTTHFPAMPEAEKKTKDLLSCIAEVNFK